MIRGAVVIGGSVAGLLVARVLSDHVPRVLIIERDELAPLPLVRRGTPQAHHQHTLMPRGLSILCRLFPGIESELVAQGAIPFDLADDVAFLTRGGWACRFPSGLRSLSCSRVLLEWVVRQRVCGLAGVELQSGRGVSGLSLDRSTCSVDGVRLHGGGGSEVVVQADLVVDASGRGSRMPTWLADLGFPRPEEEVIDPAVGYASRTFARPAAPRHDWTVAYVQAAPPHHTRGGMLFPIEGDRWRVSLIGYSGDHPPTDEHGFREFSRSLRHPIIHEALREAEPLSPVTRGRSSANRLRRYEHLSPRPEGLLVVGDAACALNPVFAQGMTVAAVHAETMERCLRERAALAAGGVSFTAHAQSRLASAQQRAWRLNRVHDGPVAAGRRDVTWADRALRRYVTGLGRLGCTQPGARRAMLEIAGLVRSPLATFRPSLAAAMSSRASTPRAVLWAPGR